MLEVPIMISGDYLGRLLAMSKLVDMSVNETAELCFYYGLGHLEALREQYPADFQSQIAAIKSMSDNERNRP